MAKRPSQPSPPFQPCLWKWFAHGRARFLSPSKSQGSQQETVGLWERCEVRGKLIVSWGGESKLLQKILWRNRVPRPSELQAERQLQQPDRLGKGGVSVLGTQEGEFALRGKNTRWIQKVEWSRAEKAFLYPRAVELAEKANFFHWWCSKKNVKSEPDDAQSVLVIWIFLPWLMFSKILNCIDCIVGVQNNL